VLKDETIASLPEEYKDYDKALDKAMYSTMDDPALKQLSGMYGMTGMPPTMGMPEMNEDQHASSFHAQRG